MKKKRLTKGENFLPDIGIDKLKALRKKEKDAKAGTGCWYISTGKRAS